ncbi:MAG: hypothetical protein LC642_07410, partial [Verrucomicrobiaceae bacterium]|nr:hypothetical protein [Verrucomicrobiaceae bacterium]
VMEVLPDDAGDGAAAHEAHDNEAFLLHREEEEENAERPTPNAQCRIRKEENGHHPTFHVQLETRKSSESGLSSIRDWAFGVGRSAFSQIEALTISR